MKLRSKSPRYSATPNSDDEKATAPSLFLVTGAVRLIPRAFDRSWVTRPDWHQTSQLNDFVVRFLPENHLNVQVP